MTNKHYTPVPGTPPEVSAAASALGQRAKGVKKTGLTPAEIERRREQGRRIEPQDIQFIADHVSKGLTETMAVSLLGKFKPQRWFDYKCKGKRTAKIADLFARTLAARQNNLVENIATVADIDRAKTAGVRHDWRAAQMLAGLHDDRFRAQRDSATTTNQTAIIVGAGGESSVLKMLDAIYSQAGLAQLPKPTQPQIDCPADGHNDDTKRD